MANSLYPAWLRSPTQRGFVEQLQEEHRDELEWFRKNTPLQYVPPRALPKVDYSGSFIKPFQHKGVCWSCKTEMLDSYVDDVCSGCRRVICPACGACTRSIYGCDWINKYGYYFISHVLLYAYHPYTREFRRLLLSKRRRRSLPQLGVWDTIFGKRPNIPGSTPNNAELAERSYKHPAIKEHNAKSARSLEEPHLLRNNRRVLGADSASSGDRISAFLTKLGGICEVERISNANKTLPPREPLEADSDALIDIVAANEAIMRRFVQTPTSYVGATIYDAQDDSLSSSWRSPNDVIDRSTMLIWLKEGVVTPTELISRLEKANVHPKVARTAVSSVWEKIKL